jgi:hypothetical protein
MSEGRGIGRPTKYDPAYVEEVIDFMAQGLSLSAFAGYLRVSRITLDNWRRVHPEFEEAVQVAKACRTEKLERDFLGTEISAVVQSRRLALMSSAPDEWCEKRVYEHTGANGGPIQTADAAWLATATDEELDALEQARAIIDRASGRADRGGDQGGTGAAPEDA